MYLIYLVLILITYNVVVNRLLHNKWHVWVSVMLSTVTIWWVVKEPTVSLYDIGINLANLVPGTIYGLLALGVICLGILIGISVPFVREFFKDDRAKDLSVGELAYKTLVNIPIGTVFMEEVIFRGVMLTLLLQSFSQPTAVIVSSLLFGIWHILPAVTNITTNNRLQGFNKPGFSVVVGTVVVTFFAGVAFCWLRIVSGSLLAPMIAHYATNSGSMLASWISHKVDK